MALLPPRHKHRWSRKRSRACVVILGSFLTAWFIVLWYTVARIDTAKDHSHLVPCPKTGCAPTSKTASPAISRGRKNLLIIATVPKDARHVAALWSELECFTADIDKIVLSAPDWSKSVMDPLVAQARSILQLNVEALYFTNDRYDVGLWCDALFHQGFFDSNPYDYVILLNDSVFALRPFTRIQDEIFQHNYSLVGLSYSQLNHYWLESIYRAFTADAVRIYMNHSCVPATHPSFCRNETDYQVWKRCIVEYHEIAIAGLYPRQNILGLYSSDPKRRPQNISEIRTWVNNKRLWHNLYKGHSFPLAKVNPPHFVPQLDHELIANCTKQMDLKFIQKLDYAKLAPNVKAVVPIRSIKYYLWKWKRGIKKMLSLD